MFQVNNFISFHDLTPDANFLWASSSITDCLGFEPEEVVGIPAYSLLRETSSNLGNIQNAHKVNVEQERVGSQVITHFICKDGSTKACTVMFSVCYDYIVTCTTVIDASNDYAEAVSHSHAMTREQTAKKQQEFDRIQRHQEAFDKHSHSWKTDNLDPEPRACMILNRFTRSLVIMYASPSSRDLFSIDPEAIIGKPLLLFIRADDLASFVVQMDVAKSTTAVAHMRFWFQSPNCPQEIPCEAMMFGAADGMIMIMRRCRPFIRKPLIKSTDNPRTASSASYPVPEGNAYAPYILKNKTSSSMRTHHYHTNLDLTEVAADDTNASDSDTETEHTSNSSDVLELDMSYPSHYYFTSAPAGYSQTRYSAPATTPAPAGSFTDDPRPIPLSLIDLAEQARHIEDDDQVLTSELESYDEAIVGYDDEHSMNEDASNVDKMEWDIEHPLS
ncbi:hypothetical protein DFQ27_001902 [Actinomortierella ambigua]|uniref:PAS domain-containing protein n=1 Tax=Actinomortierella ambigua TaxID=1343610 RepID=A0A9P6U7S6_9FUNG|nr:hypothetical protein DFQ27_001902 [Actinomortierella ambigua]